MRSISLRAWLLTIVSGVLQVLLFPLAGPAPRALASLGWVALVPLLIALLRPGRTESAPTPQNAALLGYLCGLIWYAGNCFWIYQTMYLYGGLPKPVALGILLLFSLYLGLYHALFSWFVVRIANSRAGISGALVLAPFGWVAVELARSRITGFPWDLLGYSQIDNLFFTRLAPFAGVMSLGFALMCVNSALASAFLLKRRSRFSIAGVALLVAAGVEIGGLLQEVPEHKSLTHFAIMLQENLEVGAIGKGVRPIPEREELPIFAAMTEHPGVEQGTGKLLSLLPGMEPTVVIWPEAPSHLRSDQPVFRSAIGALVREIHAPAIVGSLGVDFAEAAPKGYFLYDSASLFDVTGEYIGRYDKVHLVPWGEYIPFKQFFGFASKLTEGVADMDRGTQRRVFAAEGHSYGIFICYESIFGEEVRQFVNNGAQVLVNISDDGWYGDTGAPWQHLNMTRMRAIENHRWLLLDTNTGITTAIDPEGRALAEAPRHVRGAFAFPFDFLEGTTFYTRHGDWFAWGCVLVCIGASLSPRRSPTVVKPTVL